MERETYYMYLSTTLNQLVFKEYSGDVVYTIPLYFTSLKKDSHTLPCFEVIEEKRKRLTIRVNKGSAIGSGYDSKYLDITNW
jgi:hypothetical protein